VLSLELVDLVVDELYSGDIFGYALVPLHLDEEERLDLVKTVVLTSGAIFGKKELPGYLWIQFMLDERDDLIRDGESDDLQSCCTLFVGEVIFRRE